MNKLVFLLKIYGITGTFCDCKFHKIVNLKLKSDNKIFESEYNKSESINPNPQEKSSYLIIRNQIVEGIN